MVALSLAESTATLHRQDLSVELQIIEQRLAEGYRMIDEAIARGRSVKRWEDRWLELLHDYERVYHELIA